MRSTLSLLVLLLAAPVSAQTRTFAWTHTQANTDRYELCIDTRPCVDKGKPALVNGEVLVSEALSDGTYAVVLKACNVGGCVPSLSSPVTLGIPGATLSLTLAVDNAYTLFVNGVQVGAGSNWMRAGLYTVSLRPGPNVIALTATDAGGIAGALVHGVSGPWKVSTVLQPGWASVDFDDSAWATATSYGAYGVAPWLRNVTGMPATTAQWIWSANADADNVVYLRAVIAR